MTRKPAPGQESAALLKIAVPLIFAYLADVLMVVTTKIVIGKLGYFELAAAGVSADIGFQLAIIVKGLFSVVGVFASEAYGASRKNDALVALLRGLVLAAVFGIALTAITLSLGPILALGGQDPQIIETARPFFTAFAWSMVPATFFGVFRSFVSALMRTGFIMFITVSAVFVNYALMQGLVHGSFGLPRLGLAGAGWAWSLSIWYMCGSLAVYTAWLVRREKLSLRGRPWVTGFRSFVPILALGLPVAGIVALEAGLFAAVSLMSGMLGAKALAAYQMMMGWISIPFVISLGLAEAAMVRVSYWMGAGHPAAARQAGNLGMAIGVAVPLALVSIPLAAPWIITRAFLSPADQGYAEIAALVAQLLVIAAIFQVFDGLQAIASHALRGLRDASLPLLIAGSGYWIVGLGSSYLLAFKLGWGVIGLWWGLALGLIFTGTLLAWRFEILARRGRYPLAAVP